MSAFPYQKDIRGEYMAVCTTCGSPVYSIVCIKCENTIHCVKCMCVDSIKKVTTDPSALQKNIEEIKKHHNGEKELKCPKEDK